MAHGAGRGALGLALRLLSGQHRAVAAGGVPSGLARLQVGSPLVQLWRGFASLPPHTELAMPALSPTMTQGNIAKWYVKAGDEIGPGTVLADIETDKATLAFENQEDGFVAAIVRPEGSKDVPVGATVAIVVEEAGDVAAFANYSSSSSSSSSSAGAAAPAAAAPAAAAPALPAGGSFPAHIALKMPALSPTMEQGNIVSWAVKEGDEVTAGTVLAEIETDKATLAFENQDDGFVARILKPAGSKDVAVGELVAVIVEDAADIPAFASYSASGAGGGAAAAAAATLAPAAAAASAAPRAPANSRLGPAARKALAEAGLSPGDIAAPSGPRAIITKADVAAAVAAGVKPGSGGGGAAAAGAAVPPAAAPTKPAAAAAPTAAKSAAAAPAAPPAGGSYTDVPTSQVRQVIARRLLESKLGAPSLYVTADVCLDALSELRSSLAAQGTKLSVNDFVLRAAALALRDVPAANAAWDGAAGRAVPAAGVDVCVAVATDGGLLTPIVKGADAKSLAAISAEVKELAGRARAGKLKPEEFMGGSFSVSNLGMFGLDSFSAILNPPQAAILAVGGAQARVVLSEDDDNEGGGGFGGRRPGVSSVMSVTLTADARVIDEPLAAAWLEAFAGYMQSPLKLMV